MSDIAPTLPKPKRRGATANSLPPRVRAIVLRHVLASGFLESEFMGRRKVRRGKFWKVAHARWACWAELRTLVFPNGKPPSTPQIAEWFGMDHSSVVYGLMEPERRAAKSRRGCEDYRARVQARRAA